MVRRLVRIAFASIMAWGIAGGGRRVTAEDNAAALPRRILLVAGTVDGSHPPGTHDHVKAFTALQRFLENSTIGSRVSVRLVTDGWSADLSDLRASDTIVLYSNGADRRELDHPFLVGDRWEEVRRAMDRGCGLVLLHWSTFLPDRVGADAIDWVGGYFDYSEEGSPPAWYSKIQHATSVVKPADADHPICRGLAPFRLADEYYYHMRFGERDPRVRPILKVALPNEDGEQTVAWAVERANGGRGFVFTGFHFLNSLELPLFRRMLLNAFAWTAHVDVPTGGVELDEERPIRAIIVTGAQHPAHAWRETSLALEDELKRDPRMRVESVPDPEFLALPRLRDYDVVLLNYCNWNQAAGLSDEAKRNFTAFLSDGGGLVLVHFSNGAFHFSLPDAGVSDWPEYRTRICRRVWDHSDGKSGHDAYGPFRVDVSGNHPITEGLASFDTRDELYFRQQGDAPIEVLATALSQVTGHDEPMAFVYDYGRGRVFQTVLGHAVESIRSEGTSELFRRGTAWAAGRRPVPQADVAPRRTAITEGKFGQALDARRGHAVVEHHEAHDTWPLTVECWARIQSKDAFQILVAKNAKSSAGHWELYTYAGTGDFSVYLPGYAPSEIRSGIGIADGQWHHTAMTFDGRRMRLFVDGKFAKEEFLEKGKGAVEPGPLWIGAIPPSGLGCDGMIDDVRISKTIRVIESVPEKALASDEHTVGLWSFDGEDANACPDASPLGNTARIASIEAGTDRGTTAATDHFEGFRESQVVDDRASGIDTGRFLFSSIAVPGAPVWKGIVVRVGEDRSASVCFDTELMRMSAAWDGYLRFSATRFGLIEMPQPESLPRIATDRGPGWARGGSFVDPRPKAPYGTLPDDWARYVGLYVHDERVVISYRVGGTRIDESPWFEVDGPHRAFTRSFEVESGDAEQRLRICRAETPVHVQSESRESTRLEEADGHWIVRIAARDRPLRFRIWMSADGTTRADQLESWADARPLDPVGAWREPGRPRWTATWTTRGRVADDSDGAYVVDSIPLPFDNPYRALLFASGHDFFSDGDAAVCTAHGDVWRVSGLDASLAEVRWKRMAAGLFQPLGLKILDDVVHVTCRDQLCVLRDTNGDGEVDFFENRNNAGHVTGNGHEYVTNLECDVNGDFLMLKGDSGGVTDHDGCLLRVRRDGSSLDVVATGIRNGNGLCVLPDGRIVGSPQEGTWTPASCVLDIKPGGFYGMMDVHHRAAPPSAPDPPLCYIPRPLDNSSGGQVWVERNDWGPLSRQLLHFSFGRCRMMLIVTDTVDGQRQGAVMPLPIEFESGAMRGRFHPKDGHLYVTGLRGWVTSAVRDGCFQRVRYTGRPACLPIEWQAVGNGVRIRFSTPLDVRSATQPANYAVEAWNYRWSREYGSDDYQPNDPDRKGRAAWDVRSASVVDGGTSVFLEIPDIRPVHQLAIQFSLADADGRPVQSSLHATVHRVRATRIEPTAPLDTVARIPESVRTRLQPGLWSRWTDADGGESIRVLPLAAFGWDAGSLDASASTGPIGMTANGWLRCERRERVRFHFHGSGAASLRIDGLRVLDVENSELHATASAWVPLDPGPHRIEIDARLEPVPSKPFRLTWSSDRFREESIPARLWRHDPDEVSPRDRRSMAAREGRTMFASFRCARCHATAEPDGAVDRVSDDGPSLAGIGDRIRPEWLVAWIRDPAAVRRHATMPNLLLDAETSTRDALDLTAYLIGPRSSDDESRGARAGLSESGERVRRGAHLFESLGCVACHSTREGDNAPDSGRFESPVPLDHVASKFRPGALAAYLRNPQAHYPTTSMPRFALLDDESDCLEAYLRVRATDPPPTVPLDASDPDRGRGLFESLRCGACHAAGSPASDMNPAPKTRLDASRAARGCLAEDSAATDRAPRFTFVAGERESLRAGLAEVGPGVRVVEAAAEFSRVADRLRCAACHDTDERAAAWPRRLAEDGELGIVPERIPSLVWAGEKLRTEWIERLVAGERTYRSRPWLAARMPAFPHDAKAVARGLAARHGVPTESDAKPPRPTADEWALAERLLGTQGLDCRQCHAPADEDLRLANQSQGIGLALMSDRLRGDFFQRWLRDPLRIDPATKMPQFTTDGRTTKAAHLADGNADTQFVALWRYLHALEYSGRP